MKTKRPNWKLLLLCAIPFVPLLAATSFRDGAYRVAARIIPDLQHRVDNELIVAIENNNLSAVKKAVSRGADVNPPVVKDGYPLLVRAVQYGMSAPRYDVATYLLQQGANPNIGAAGENKPLFFRVAENELQQEFDKNDAKAVRFLRQMLDLGVQTSGEHSNADLLYQAVQLQSIRHVQALLQNGANPNALLNTSGNGTSTPLLAAVNAQNTTLVKLLLEHKADPNGVGRIYTNYYTNPPLLHILYEMVDDTPLTQRKREIVQLLLQHGARVNQFISEEDPMQVMNSTPRNPHRGWTALMSAAVGGDLPTVQLLLQHGANPKLRDKSGKTALDYARREKHVAVVRVLEARSF